MKQYLAFDIGGTTIKYGVVNQDGDVLVSDLMDTEAQSGGPAIVDKVIKKGRELLQDHRVEGIGISTAGQVDIRTGTVVGASDSIPNYVGVEIKAEIESTLNLPVTVRNDVDCAALGEQWLGDHDVKNFIALTVGTGVGGAIVIDGKMHSGHSYSAGEWGYMIIEGERFEANASISGLIRFAKRYKEDRDWNGKEIFDLYDQGDPDIIKAVDSFYKYLAIGITNLIYIFNPEKVIVGGGVTARGDKFLQELREAVKQQIQPNFYNNTEIVLAKLSNHAGMVGAVYNLIRSNMKEME